MGGAAGPGDLLSSACRSPLMCWTPRTHLASNMCFSVVGATTMKSTGGSFDPRAVRATGLQVVGDCFVVFVFCRQVEISWRVRPCQWPTLLRTSSVGISDCVHGVCRCASHRLRLLLVERCLYKAIVKFPPTRKAPDQWHPEYHLLEGWWLRSSI